jgi:hypothetical protein
MSTPLFAVAVLLCAVGLVAGVPPLRRVPGDTDLLRRGAPRRDRPDQPFTGRGRPLSTTGLADLALLFAVGLLSGLSVALTCRRIARTVNSPEAAMLATVVERQRRGQPLLDALHDTALVSSAPARRGRRRPPVAASMEAGMARTIGLLRSQIEDGAAVADALLELSMSLRDEARRRAETQARRLPVRMLLPLIVCVLPGFLCLTVAPVIIESLRGVSL